MIDKLSMRTSAEFELNAFYERLIELRRSNLKAFNSLSPASHAALLEYEKQKREHAQAKEAK